MPDIRYTTPPTPPIPPHSIPPPCGQKDVSENIVLPHTLYARGNNALTQYDNDPVRKHSEILTVFDRTREMLQAECFPHK